MRLAYFRMHLAIFLWGFTGILGKAIAMNEGMIVWYRMAISALGLIPFLAGYRSLVLPWREMGRIAFVGFLVALHWLLFYGAIKASNVTIALSCFSSISLFTTLLDSMVHKQRPKLAELLLSIMVILGIYIIFRVQEVYAVGIMLAVASAFLGAAFTVLNKKLTYRHPPVTITFYELVTGFVILTLLLPVWFSLTGTGMELPSLTDGIYLLLLSLVCTSFAFTISLRALKKLDAFTLNLSVNLEPVYSIVLALIIFGEREILDGDFFTGTFIILASVVAHTWYRWWKNR